MIGQVSDPLFHFSSPEEVGNFALYQKSGHHGKHVDRNRHSAENDQHVEYAQAYVLAGVHYLAVPDSRQRDDCHIEGLQKANRAATQQPVAKHA